MAPFLSLAVDLVRRRARAARAGGDVAAVAAAAHLYAVGQQILASQGSARVAGLSYPRPSPVDDAAHLWQRLERLPAGLDAAALFHEVAAALIFLERDFAASGENWLPRSTAIEELSSGGMRFLGGVVHHWHRPKSALAHERRWRFEAAGPGRPPTPAPCLDDYLHQLSFYWEDTALLPRVRRVVAPRWGAAPLFQESGRDFLRQGFRVALCPLRGSFHPRFRIHPKGGGFFRVDAARGIARRAALHDHLDALCIAAHQQQVQFLVLPELTVDSEAREHLQASLRRRRSRFPYAVIAGSFHCWQDGASRRWSAAPPHNEAMLYDQRGRELAVHRKRGRFRISAALLGLPSPLFPRERRTTGELEREILEDIEYGAELQILDTTLGRLAFLICADAIVADDRGYLPVLRRLRPDLVLVIAMSHETEPFRDFAAEMSRYRIGTMLVNAHCLCSLTRRPVPPATLDLAACDLALFEPAERPPTRICWPIGGEPQCRYFKPRDRLDRSWRETHGAPTVTGVSWLGGEARLGLMVDLGVHSTPSDGDEQ